MRNEWNDDTGLRAWYVDGICSLTHSPYDQLWIERGSFSSFGGEINFDGEREIESGVAVLEQARLTYGDLYIGRLKIDRKDVRDFITWLEREVDPMLVAYRELASVGDLEGYWEV